MVVDGAGCTVVRSLTTVALVNKSYIVIAGPTASGKSQLGMAIAGACNGEIIACDSVQVYRGLSIGAAKPSAEDQAQIPHHLLDCAAPQDPYDAGTYGAAATVCIADIIARRRCPLVVGGTGLYLRALLGQGWHADLPADPQLRASLDLLSTAELWSQLVALDPQRAGELHANDRVRIRRSVELVTLLGKPLRDAGLTASAPRDPAAFLIVLAPARIVLHERIEERTQAMLAGGLIAEVEGLLAAGVSPLAKPMQSIGYRQVCDYLGGQLPHADLAAAIVAATRQYAKRQTTWFRKLNADLRLDGSETFGAILEALPKAWRQR